MVRLQTTVIALALLMSVLWGSIAVLAQEPTPAQYISLKECLIIAKKNQIDLLRGQQSLLSAKAKVIQQKSTCFPQATMSYNPISINGTSGGKGLGSQSSGTGASLTITQNIYDGGLREAQLKAANYNTTQSEASLQRSEQTVVYNVTSAYYTALRARHLADVSDAKVKALEEQRKMVHARIDAGDAAKSDELPILSQLANARVDVLTAKNTIRTAVIQLQSAMGLPAQHTFEIADVTMPEQVEAAKDMDSYVKEALLNRPDINGTSAGLNAAKMAVKTAKINMLPRLVSDGQYSLDTGGGTTSNWTVGVGIAYNLFDGSHDKAVYQSARAEQTIAEQEAVQLAKDIAAQVQEAYLNLTSAQERIAAAQLSAQASQQNLDVQQERYKEGLATPLDLLNAETDLATAQNTAIGACYDYYTAKAQLDYAIGK